MKRFITSILLLAGLNAAAQKQLPGKVHFGLVYPVSTNGTHAAQDTNSFSLNLIGGLSAAERGSVIAGLSNVVIYDVKGPMIAGFSNHVGKTVDGALFSGFLNTYGGGHNTAVGGFANVASAPLKGAQFAGFANIAKEVRGLQVAGFINTAKDVKGSQFSGFINIAKKIKGAQIAGFINIADSSDFPIGIINIIKNGEKSMGLSIDENQTTMLSFRSGGRILYGILGLGYNFKNDDAVFAAEAGLGAHLLNFHPFRLNTELVASSLFDFKRGDYFKSSLRVMPAIKLGQYLEIFGGPSLNFVTTNTLEGEKLRKKYIETWEPRWDEDFKGLYFGYTAGITFSF